MDFTNVTDDQLTIMITTKQQQIEDDQISLAEMANEQAMRAVAAREAARQAGS